MPRYFLHLPEAAAPLEFDPDQPPPERHDTRYWSAVFRAMEPHLSDPDLDVYLTFDCRSLPRYGERVVAIVLGDEIGQIPRYVDRVAAVFKCYGTRPWAGAALRPTLTDAAAAALAGSRWIRWLPGAAAFAATSVRRAAGGQPVRRLPTAIPLGTFNQLEVDWQPPARRPIDIFFAGSVEHRDVSPKTRARHEMLASVRRLMADRPQLRVDIRLTADFAASEHASAQEYSQALMSSRICLAPRGTSVETFRLLEGLRCGCVVVCDRLPPRWFYAGGPFVQLARWSALGRALAPFLDAPNALARAHEESLQWWHERCSPNAVGRFLAQRLNQLPSAANESRSVGSAAGSGQSRQS